MTTIGRTVAWLVLAWWLAATPAAGQGEDAVWSALRTPGAVVILRHSYAPGTYDPPTARADDCSTQRNLDERGRAQAGRIGEAFRRNEISVGAVLSSPRCRCLETGRLAFGQAQTWEPLRGAINDEARHQRQLADIRKAIAAHQSGPPLVLITHGSVVSDLTGLSIGMGAFVVLKPGPDGGHSVAGRLYVE